MCIQTGRRHHKALQCGNEYAKHDQLFLELYPGSVLFSPSGKHSFVSLSSYVCLVLSVRQPYSFVSLGCPTSVLFSPSGKHSFVSLSCPMCLVFSVTQASIASCHSAVLRLPCFSNVTQLSYLCLALFVGQA